MGEETKAEEDKVWQKHLQCMMNGKNIYLNFAQIMLLIVKEINEITYQILFQIYKLKRKKER